MGSNKQILTGRVPGIPTAPGGKRNFQTVDYDFQKRKLLLGHKLPFMTKDEVTRRKHPYHVLLLHDLMSRGYYIAVQEINNILRKEERERKGGKYRHLMGDKLVDDKIKFKSIIDVLKICQDFTDQENYESPTLVRKHFGEKLMKDGDIWLSKHFLFSALQTCFKIKSEHRQHLEAEIHCLLAFLARDNTDSLEEALESAVDHLTVCRELSKNQPWQFKPKVLSIRLKKPITLHGLRDEYETVDGSSMTLYMIATLLEHEMLIGLANQVLHTHKYPTEEDIWSSHVFANNALKLAFEVRQPCALSSALMRFGIVLRHTGAFDEAMMYFKQLIQHSELTGDQDGYAIACHNIAMCQIGKHEAINALESLARQKDISEEYNLEDLEADALQELGHVLLQEGQLWESEECYTCAYEAFARLEEINHPPHSHCSNNLAMWAIAAGQKLWSRFSGLARHDKLEHTNVLMEWKNRRQSLVPVPRPNYELQTIEEEQEHDYSPEPVPLIVSPALKLDENKETNDDEEMSDPQRLSKSVGFTDEEKLAISHTRHSDEVEDEFYESDVRPKQSMRLSILSSTRRSTIMDDGKSRKLSNPGARRSTIMDDRKQRKLSNPGARRSTIMDDGKPRKLSFPV